MIRSLIVFCWSLLALVSTGAAQEDGTSGNVRASSAVRSLSTEAEYSNIFKVLVERRFAQGLNADGLTRDKYGNVYGHATSTMQGIYQGLKAEVAVTRKDPIDRKELPSELSFLVTCYGATEVQARDTAEMLAQELQRPVRK